MMRAIHFYYLQQLQEYRRIGCDGLMVKDEDKHFAYTTHRIGGTTYKVKVVFNDTGHETMEDKILRIIQSETVTSNRTCDIMESPQMSRQSERSAS